MASIELLDLNEPITSALCVVVAGTDETDLVAMGSGVIFTDGLALTARHVIDEIFERFEGCRASDARGDLSFGVQVCCHFPDRSWAKWHVEEFVISSSIDIAALVLRPSEETPSAPWPQAPAFSPLYPAESWPLVAYGFPESRHRLLSDGSAKFHLSPSRANGIVHEIYHEKRDSSMAPFPCIRTDAPFPPGISGGPVCDRHGRVIGLVCSGMPPAEGETEHVSYVSTLWPAFGLVLRKTPVTGLPQQEQSLLEFAQVSRANVHHLDHLVVQMDDDKQVILLRPPT
jgi:hypothetical protein